MNLAPAACELLEGDCLDHLPGLRDRLAGQVRLVYLDPPYNTRRRRGARRHFGDSARDWTGLLRPVVDHAFHLLRDDGFLAASINQMELFRLKPLVDDVFGPERFVGLFPVKIRHAQRQLMINATFHDLFEYLLIYRRDRATRFHTRRQPPRIEKFCHHVKPLVATPERRELGGKQIEIYRPGEYEIQRGGNGQPGLRRYVIAGKLATANWSGEWYEKHLRPLGDDLLVKVHGLEREGLGYRWFQTGNRRRRSGVYFQSLATAGRPVLPTNDIDLTEVTPGVYKEGGPGCDFKDSKKPEALMRLLLEICTQGDDLVLDPMAGSGTMAAVALQMGRRCLAIERHAEALAIIRRRLEQLETRAEDTVESGAGSSQCDSQ
jgi:adenine-specific DNA-methyltransferase